jgi:hypothetical protein
LPAAPVSAGLGSGLDRPEESFRERAFVSRKAFSMAATVASETRMFPWIA